MNRQERKRYKNFKKQYGQQVADAFQQWVAGGKKGGRGSFNPQSVLQPTQTTQQGTPGPGAVDFNNPQSIIDAQSRYNEQAQRGTTPNVNNDFGSREVVRNPDGSVTVNDQMTGANRELYDQSVANQKRINDAFSSSVDTAMGQQPFNPQQGQRDLTSFQGAQQQSYGQYQDPRQTQVQAPGQFRDVQQRTYNDALQSYSDATREDQSFRRELLEQQLANEGVPRGSEKYQNAMRDFNRQADQQLNQVSRDAYRDSHDVASQSFQNQLGAQGQEFGQNRAAQNDQFSQTYAQNDQQYGQALQTNTTQFDQGLAANQQQFGQNVQSHMMPHTIAQGYMGAQGQFQNPGLGAVQQIQAPNLDVTNFGLGMAGLNQRADQFGQQMDYNRWAKQGDWRTARGTAGAGSLGMADRMQLANHQAQLQRDNWAFQQGLGGNQFPQQTGWGDVAGAAVGGIASGIGQGIAGGFR